MKMPVLAAVLAAFAVAAGGPAAGQDAGKETVALVGGRTITAADLEAEVRGELLKLRAEEYRIKRRALERLVGQHLLAQEAAARKLSVDELLRAEVEEKALPVTADEVRAAWEREKPRFGGAPEADGRKAAEDRLVRERRRERLAALTSDLRSRAGVKILLDPYRAVVSADDDPAVGPANAPVTIVEFADYQCSFCARVQPTLKQVRGKYGDRVRLVFRDYPLPNHGHAQKAAEAATCAGDQGRYWEMHDRLFADIGKLAVPELKAHAAALGLDPAAFGTCLDSGRHEQEWRKDMADGAAAGVSGTPAFFINGRLVAGAQPLERFAEVIDDELARAGVLPPPPDEPAGGMLRR